MLLHLGTLLHLGQNVITFRTLLHLGSFMTFRPSTSFPRQLFHTPSGFPSLFLSNLESGVHRVTGSWPSSL